METSGEKRASESGAVRAALVIVMAALGLWLAYELRVLIVDLLMTLTLASAIAPVAEWGEARKVPRIATVLAVYVLVVLAYALIAVFLAPVIWEQAVQLYKHLPGYMSGVMDWYKQLLDMVGEQGDAFRLEMADVRPGVLKLVGQTLDITKGLLGLILNGILVAFLTAYFVVEANDIWPALLNWVPPRHRLRAAELIRPLAGRMGGYVRGQLLVSIAVGAFLAVGLTSIGVKYSLILGVLAGFLNLMPFVGSLLTASFSVLVAANQSLLTGALTLGLFGLEQWFESNVIVPQLLGKQVELHPVMVLFSILIGASLMGILGALVAVPVASAALLLAEELYVKPMNARAVASP